MKKNLEQKLFEDKLQVRFQFGHFQDSLINEFDALLSVLMTNINHSIFIDGTALGMTCFSTIAITSVQLLANFLEFKMFLNTS